MTKEVFHFIPVAPEDRFLLAMLWKGEPNFPFSTILFTVVADAIKWIIHKRGVHQGLQDRSLQKGCQLIIILATYISAALNNDLCPITTTMA